ncbi:titin homolog, partial [Channa argus]|uniref:titin homolog n=1 Tax=Channa argus TaxID=215402 RepID=UPI00351FBFAC
RILSFKVGWQVLRCETNLLTDKGASCDSEAPVASSSQLQIDWEQQNTPRDEEVGEGTDYKASVGNEEEHVGSQKSEAVLALCFSEDQSFSKASLFENQDLSGDEQCLLDSTHSVESNIKEAGELIIISEQRKSEMFSLEDENINESYGEEEIEPSTDEESRLWRYPQQNVYKEEESVTIEEQKAISTKDEECLVELSGVQQERGGSNVDDTDHSYVQGDASYLVNVCAEVSASSKSQKDEILKSEAGEFDLECSLDDPVKDQCPLNQEGNLEYYKGCYEEATKELKNSEESTNEADECQYSKENQTVNIKEGCTEVKEIEASQTGSSDVQRNIDAAKASAELLDTNRYDQAYNVTEAQASEHYSETEEMEQEAVAERQDAIDVLTEKNYNEEGRESSKKVTFILEPELINSSSMCETSISMEPETSTSGKYNDKM